ncbi:hypothetical protein like AT1G59970 [Hibiscus trionum]|uniref:Peptidase metallopeptidase domain-containing protein n=1 Tax=Hibiscus trionum TaxID=183268 RepID=A0A9W7H3B1_HIBTR|nr:hypothetical protein like AT1G59970 [Hibiscus trionum]
MASNLFHQLLRVFFLFLVLQPFAVKSLQLEFLGNLEGVQKGEIANGINQVKQYLKMYGYYYPHEYDTKRAVLDDHFDEKLENALKAYQQYYSLNVTGTIDSDTMKSMATPRCGVPDIIPNPTSKTTQEMSPVIADAFQKWAAVSPFKFTQAQGGKANINLGFFPKNHGDAPFRDITLAHAFSPQDGRLHFNEKWNWALNKPAPDQIHLKSVAVHELGHIIGLGHSQVKDAVMFSAYSPGTIKTDLDKDDIDGLKDLYGY